MVARLPGLAVVVGMWPAEASKRLPGCICAYEWYPFYGKTSMGMPTRSTIGAKGRMPEAWILQWRFAWTTAEMDRNYPPPTWEQRARLLAWVTLHHPLAKLIWLY